MKKKFFLSKTFISLVLGLLIIIFAQFGIHIPKEITADIVGIDWTEPIAGLMVFLGIIFAYIGDGRIHKEGEDEG